MARKPSEARHASDSDMDDLNLTPIMGLMVILIPVLLAMFNMFEVKVQAVAAPKLGTGSSKPTDEAKKKPLNLTVLISKTGFALKQQDELQGEAEAPIRKRVFDNVGEEYDYPALYSRLMAKKRAYPDETTVNIAAEMDIPWQIVARTIDATRVQLELAAYKELDVYSKAKPKMKQGKDIDGDNKPDMVPVEMFSRVVFVVAE